MWIYCGYMAAIKDLARIVRNWKEGTGNAQRRYKEGVESPRVPWKQATLAAVENHTAGTQEALARGAFAKGVGDTPDNKQREKAGSIGPARYSQGAAAAEGDYSRGFSDYRSVIEGVVLPPRGPKGSPQNFDRVKAIGDALHARKIG